MPPIDIAQILASLGATANTTPRDILSPILEGQAARPALTAPDPADASVGPLRGIIAGLADAFQNKARGMAPNPGGISQGNALDTLTALRQRQAQREDRANLLGFQQQVEDRRAQDRREFAAGRQKQATEDRRADTAAAGLAEQSRFERGEDARLAAEGRQATARKEQNDIQDRRHREQIVVTLTRDVDMSDVDLSGMTTAEIAQEAGKRRAAARGAEIDRKLLSDMRPIRAETSQKLLADAITGPDEGESINEFSERIQLHLSNLWGPDDAGRTEAEAFFYGSILPMVERKLKSTTADRKVADLPGTAAAFGENLFGSTEEKAAFKAGGPGIGGTDEEKRARLRAIVDAVRGVMGASGSAQGANQQQGDQLMQEVMKALPIAAAPHAQRSLQPQDPQFNPTGGRLVVDPMTGELVPEGQTTLDRLSGR